MKKYNFVEPPEPWDPLEPDERSSGRLSPQARRLLIIGVLGIILAGGLYVYTRYFSQAPPSPPPPLALRERRVQLPVRPAPVKPPGAQREPAQPSVSTEPPGPEKPAAVSPKEEAATGPGLAPVKPTEAPPERTEPPSAPVVTKKPAPQPIAKATEPAIKPEKKKGQYTVQVASLVVKENVISLKKRLEKLGYTPVVRMTNTSITRHHVYGGEFNSRAEAEETARRLNVDGVPTNLVAAAGGKFRLEVGSSFRLDEAIDLARNLQKKNYTPKIVSEPAPTTVHKVWVGEYESRAEALRVLEELKKQGFAPLIVKR